MPQKTMKKTVRTPVRDSVEQVWLAGLGALAMTENEGTRLFRNLVKQGEGFEKATRARLDKAMQRARAVPGNTMSAVEEGLDDTMERVMHRLGVPTRREISSLTKRVEGLTTTLEKRSRPARTTTRPRTGTRRKAASKLASPVTS